MSKKQSRRKHSRDGASPRRKRFLAALTLAFVCVVGTSMLAQVQSLKKSKKASTDFSVASLASGGPSKEYIYAGGKLVATVEPTAVGSGGQTYDAQFVSMVYLEPCANILPPPLQENWLPIGVGSFGDPGQTYKVRVTMKNTGSALAAWSSSSFHLGSQNPAGNTAWGTSTVNFPAGVTSVPSGSQVTFEFDVKKQASGSGFLNFQWQMVGPGNVGSFGEKTRNGVIAGASALCLVAAPDYATFVSQSVPSVMFAGQSCPVSITMNNSGTTTWSLAGNYKLGSQFPQDNTYWGTNRVSVPTSVPPGANITFNFNVTAPATPGAYNFQWMMVQDGGAGWFGYLTQGVSVLVLNNTKAVLGYLDFNNDGKTDIAVWRPSTRQWYVDTDQNGSSDISFQFYDSGTDTPVPGDYDGNGRADAATFRRVFPYADWFFDYDLSGGPFDGEQNMSEVIQGPIPCSQDYDGDGITDAAVFSLKGKWFIWGEGIQFGTEGDIPVPADYNLDGHADLAVFRPSSGTWYIDTDQDGASDITVAFGQNGDIPVPMDYNGDGAADFAVFRPSTNQWFIDINRDGSAEVTVTFGTTGDIPVPGDYNGDGKADIADFRPSTGQWFIDTNNDGVADKTVTFGQNGDTPLRQNGWILKAMGILP